MKFIRRNQQILPTLKQLQGRVMEYRESRAFRPAPYPHMFTGCILTIAYYLIS